MHVRQLTVRDIRAIRELELLFEDGDCAGWHVMLGDNGTGKSTVVRALATVLMGAENAHASRQDWSTWVREGATCAHVRVQLEQHPDVDAWAGRGKTVKNALVNASFNITPTPDAVRARGSAAMVEFEERYAKRTVWGTGGGWFCASFGPFRRFTGGDPDINPLYHSHPRLAPHLTALGEHVALPESLRWLKDLAYKASVQLDEDAQPVKDAVLGFVNNAGLLPYGARVDDVTVNRISMADCYGTKVAIEEMSDGYRSILSITLELLRLMFRAFGVDAGLRAMRDGKVYLPGVVAIDEVDAHLHPQWQKRIGEWFVERFPVTQFLVTTHSPIVCRAAAVRGSVWKLPSPGSAGLPYRVVGHDFNRLVHGNILEAFSTDLFGEGVTRSDRSDALAARLAELSQRRLHVDLTAEEESELQRLRETFPATPNGVSRG